MPGWAVLLTTHERVETTMACLDALEAQVDAGVELALYVVDSGSTDGTPEAIARRDPAATVLRRGPDLFWAQGMRVAFAYAYADGHDAYLWLNDDTFLDGDAIARLRAASEQLASEGQWPALLCGATRGTASGEITYSGLRRTSRWRPMSFARVVPEDRPVPVDTMNGNCVLVPHEVARRVGNIDRRLTHSMGDIDYGFRAGWKGFGVWLAPGTVGTCEPNPPVAVRTPVAEARALFSTKGLPPRDWATLTLRWAGPLFPLAFLTPYLRRLARSLRRAS